MIRAKDPERRQVQIDRADARAYERMERRWDAADEQIGELVRDGRPVLYAFPVGGHYREGSRAELTDFLIRNRYA